MTARAAVVRAWRVGGAHALSVLDFALFSLANFALGITLSRCYSHEAFAGFGVGLSIALILQGLQRGVFLTPAILMRERTARRYLGGIAGEQVLWLGATLAGCGAWAIAAALAGAAGVYMAAALGTLAASLIYLQSDFDRMLQVKHGRSGGAARLSAAYLLTVLAIAALAHWTALPFWGAMLALAAFGCVKAWLVLRPHGRPNLRWGRRFLAEDLRARAWWSGLGVLSYAGYAHLPLILLAALAPPRQAAAFVAMRTLAQPLQAVLRALDIADKNLVRERAGASAQGLRRVFWRTVARYAAVAGGVLLLIALAGPSLVRLAYGNRYAGLEGLAVWHCGIVLLMALMLPIESVNNVVRRFPRQIGWRLLAAGAGTTLALLLCGRIGAWGAAMATATGSLIALAGALATAGPVLWGGRDATLASERRRVPA